MNEVLVSVFARTDIGMQRSGNEDAFLVADLTTGKIGLGPDMSTHRVGERGSLMVVSDGMGGAVAGEIASELAVTTIRESLMEMPADLDISERLRMATEIANDRIWNHAQQNPELAGMGATVTAVLVQGATAYIAQVGDSRAYLVRGSNIKQLTKDQSLAQMLLDTGAIEPDQINTVPQNVIMQALGTQPIVKVVLTAVELCQNDWLLICSDGLSNKIHAEEMRQLTENASDLTSVCRRLVETANERGGEDNITVIVARFDGVGLHAAGDSGSITASFRVLNQDYVPDRPNEITGQLASPTPPIPPDKEFTTLVMTALPSMQGPQQEVPSQQKMPDAIEPPEPNATSLLTHRPKKNIPAPKEDLPNTKPLVAKKTNTTLMLIILLIALLLLAAAGYFVYKNYFKPGPEPQDTTVMAHL